MNFRRKMDWGGVVVRTNRVMRTAAYDIPEGTIAIATHWKKGLSITADKCVACGARVRLNRVPTAWVEPIGRVATLADRHDVLEGEALAEAFAQVEGLFGDTPSEVRRRAKALLQHAIVLDRRRAFAQATREGREVFATFAGALADLGAKDSNWFEPVPEREMWRTYTYPERRDLGTIHTVAGGYVTFPEDASDA